MPLLLLIAGIRALRNRRGLCAKKWQWSDRACPSDTGPSRLEPVSHGLKSRCVIGCDTTSRTPAARPGSCRSSGRVCLAPAELHSGSRDAHVAAGLPEASFQPRRGGGDHCGLP